MTPKALALLYWKQLASELAELPHKNRRHAAANEKATRRAVALVKLFHGIVDQLDTTVLFEIGAHMAETSRRFLDPEKPGRRAIAFEANPRVRTRFVDEHPETAVEYHVKAIGRRAGKVTFFAPEAQHLEIWGSLRKRRNFDKVEEISVEMVPLDTAWRQSGCAVEPHGAALWVDVEGAALEVLQSGTEALRHHVGVVFTEVNDVAAYEGAASSLALFAFMIENGFLPLARDNEWFDAWNAIFVHESRMDDIQEIFTTWSVHQARQVFA